MNTSNIMIDEQDLSVVTAANDELDKLENCSSNVDVECNSDAEECFDLMDFTIAVTEDSEALDSVITKSERSIKYATIDILEKRNVLVGSIKSYEDDLQNNLKIQCADRDTVINAVKRNGINLKYADKKFLFDYEIVMAAVSNKNNSNRYKIDEHDVCRVNDVQFECTCSHGQVSILELADPSLRADKSIVLAAINIAGCALQHAHISLRSDPEIVLAAFSNCSFSLEFAEKIVFSDRKLVLDAVAKNGAFIEFADKNLRADRDVVNAALSSQIELLQYCEYMEFNEYLYESDLFFDYAGYKGVGKSLFRFADESLKSDRDFVLAKVKQSGRALEFAHESLRLDRELAFLALKSYPESFEFAHESLKSDREFVFAALKIYPYLFEFIHDSYKSYRELVINAVRYFWRFLEIADVKFRGDKEIVMIAIKQDIKAFELADSVLKSDNNFLLELENMELIVSGEGLSWLDAIPF